ncbi:Fic family protein [Clostridioides mangenotii]|uniref:Fic family protein n=1 Tax=Metaclostridioides mangenotii TaxID=1540 RepID=UPI00214A6F3C|nr:Fic family protein [Clostridioides mangenotii]MCR1954760.1 Fic family protein [Clostridioides mangenotii]
MNFMDKEVLLNARVSMKVVKTLSKINEYKGRQIVYKKQNKDILENLSETSLVECALSTHIGKSTRKKEMDIEKLVNGEKIPSTEDEWSVVEYRDLVKTINSAYNTMYLNSLLIAELHGYLYKYSNQRGGFFRDNLNTEVENLCDSYHSFLEDDEVDVLILIATIVLEFILLRPFNKGNIKMARVLMLLTLNKNGYEVGRYVSLGKVFDESSLEYFERIKNLRSCLSRGEYDINTWLEYFLESILIGYQKLNDSLKITDINKVTKTLRIETYINSTLGYFTKQDIKDLCPDIPGPTINRVFNNLRRDDKIEVIARGRNAKWRKKY